MCRQGCSHLSSPQEDHPGDTDLSSTSLSCPRCWTRWLLLGFRTSLNTTTHYSFSTQHLNSSAHGCKWIADGSWWRVPFSRETLWMKPSLEHLHTTTEQSDWFQSYLSGTTVSMGRFRSRLLYVTCGVPQGSVLSPILLILLCSPLDVPLADMKYLFIAMLIASCTLKLPPPPLHPCHTSARVLRR